MTATLTTTPVAVDVETAAAMLGGIGKSTFLERVSRGELPRPRKIGAKLVWLVEELQQVSEDEAPVARVLRPDTALYRHFDADGLLLYVGISLSPLARLAAHNRDSEWAMAIRQVTLEWFPDRASALAAELKAIREERPAHNIAGALKC